jgi:hypothetical protein
MLVSNEARGKFRSLRNGIGSDQKMLLRAGLPGRPWDCESPDVVDVLRSVTGRDHQIRSLSGR